MLRSRRAHCAVRIQTPEPLLDSAPFRIQLLSRTVNFSVREASACGFTRFAMRGRLTCGHQAQQRLFCSSSQRAPSCQARAAARSCAARAAPPAAPPEATLPSPAPAPHGERATTHAAAGPSAAAQPLPDHVAIILDGNHRWAQRRRLPTHFGHRAGVDALRRIVKRCGDLGIPALTVFAFSADNWRRGAAEVAALLAIMEASLRSELPELKRAGVRVTFFGDLTRLPRTFRALIERCERHDCARTRMRRRLDASTEGNASTRTLVLRAGRSQRRRATASSSCPWHSATVARRTLCRRRGGWQSAFGWGSWTRRT